MALELKSVAYVLLPVTKGKLHKKKDNKNKWINNFAITESEQSKLFLWYLSIKSINILIWFQARA